MTAARAAVVLATVFVGACAEAEHSFGETDVAAVRAVEEAYRAGWEANDPDAVMATLTDDAVIMPAGAEPIRGNSAIRAYWWPADGSTTTIGRYEISVDEVFGDGDVALLRGRGALAFDYTSPEGETSAFTSNAVHLSVYTRGEDGRWRIARRAWSALR